MNQYFDVCAKNMTKRKIPNKTWSKVYRVTAVIQIYIHEKWNSENTYINKTTLYKYIIVLLP
jgi:hypothetical protein